MARRRNTKTTLAPVIDLKTEIARLKAEEVEKTAALKAAKQALEDQTWEMTTKSKNPQYMVGSLRKATEADLKVLGHNHGKVCEIICKDCSTHRLVNTQDATQTTRCRACAKKASSTRRSANTQAIEARIAQLQLKLDAQVAKSVAV